MCSRFAHHRPLAGIVSWHGSLLEDKQDATGTLYRRNRYYDPSTGRFTQEDPIGLAGGLNVYGFAAGDPVNYGDPYGLKVCFQGSPRQRERLEWQTERAIGADISVGKDGCVSAVGASGSPARARFQSLVSSDHTYTIFYGLGGSAYDAGGRRIRIDEGGTLEPIYTWQETASGRQCVNFAAQFDFVARLIAHELGHAYHHDSHWLGSVSFALTTRRRKERYALSWENLWARQNNQPERCRYGSSF